VARLLSLAVALCATFFAVTGSANAAAPCWKAVLTDSYDGRLDRTYPIGCYRLALRHVPADVDAYTSASGEIRRALLAALNARSQSVKPVSSTTNTARTRKIAASADARPAETVAAEATTPAKTALSPLVALGIAAGVLTLAASAKLL